MASVIDAATQEERLSMLPRTRLALDLTNGCSRGEKLGAMPGLGGRCGNRTTAWNALVRWQIGPALDIIGQQIKGPLRMRLYQL